jgi:putative FmdB family regulatory protein
MPLYEYECRSCDHVFEELVSRDEVVECPRCHGKKLEKLFSVPAKPAANISSSSGACGEGPPCGSPMCGRLARSQGRS